MADPGLETRIRALIERLENWKPTVGQRSPSVDPVEHAVREHWMNCGMDEAYDNVLDWLYAALGEER